MTSDRSQRITERQLRIYELVAGDLFPTPRNELLNAIYELAQEIRRLNGWNPR